MESATEAMSTPTNATVLTEAAKNATNVVLEGTSEALESMANTTGEVIEGIRSTVRA